MTTFSFEIGPRPEWAHGGGWQLKLYSHQPGAERVEEGGGIFPVTAECDSQAAYEDARAEGSRWVERVDPAEAPLSDEEIESSGRGGNSDAH